MNRLMPSGRRPSVALHIMPVAALIVAGLTGTSRAEWPDSVRLGNESYQVYSADLLRAQGITIAEFPWRENAAAVYLEAINALAGWARFDGHEHPVFVRIADYEGAVYLDLGGKDLSAVRITANGWEVSGEVPVKFIRPNGLKELPAPVQGGSIEELRPFINVDDDDAFKLVVGCLVGYLSPRGPYPILILDGEQGSAKTTTTRLLRSLIDPHVGATRPLPGSVRDLVAAAHGSWLMPFDNLSNISGNMSDHLCRLATGGGFAARKLYTDREEIAEDVQRPIILNGIGLVAWRPDLADRSIKVTLPRIDPAQRRDERALDEEFERARPGILGALCDAVAAALGRLPETNLAELPRMADFARWVTAAEPALPWESGRFVGAYARNRQASHSVHGIPDGVGS